MSAQQPDNKKIYDENWNQWVDMKSYGPGSRFLRAMIAELLAEIHPAGAVRSIADIGCGEGTNTILLARAFPNASVTGVDFSSSAIACAKRYEQEDRLSFRVDENSDILNTPHDLITCFEVLEHVPDWQDLVRRMAQASHGYLLLSFPTGRMRPFEVNVGHVRNFKVGEVESFLAAQGYEPVKLFHAGFPFYSPLYRDFCNLTNMAGNSLSRGKFGFKQKLVSAAGYFLFRHLSTKYHYGDKFIGLFRRTGGN